MTAVSARFSRSRPPVPRRGGQALAGFTLAEVLATMLLMAILLPVIMEGISLASGVADMARRRTEATGLAEMQLNYLLSSADWNNGILDGNFESNDPSQAWAADYTWHADVTAWSSDLTQTVYQLDLFVYWPSKNGRDEESISLSTLVYDRYGQYETYQEKLQNGSTSSSSTGTTVGG